MFSHELYFRIHKYFRHLLSANASRTWGDGHTYRVLSGGSYYRGSSGSSGSRSGSRDSMGLHSYHSLIQSPTLLYRQRKFQPKSMYTSTSLGQRRYVSTDEYPTHWGAPRVVFRGLRVLPFVGNVVVHLEDSRNVCYKRTERSLTFPSLRGLRVLPFVPIIVSYVMFTTRAPSPSSPSPNRGTSRRCLCRRAATRRRCRAGLRRFETPLST